MHGFYIALVKLTNTRSSFALHVYPCIVLSFGPYLPPQFTLYMCLYIFEEYFALWNRRLSEIVFCLQRVGSKRSEFWREAFFQIKPIHFLVNTAAPAVALYVYSCFEWRPLPQAPLLRLGVCTLVHGSCL